MTDIDPLDLPPPPESPAHGSNSHFDLQALGRLLLDKSWLIVTCLVVAFLAAAFYVERTPRIYTATTTVQVEQEDAKVVKAEQVVSEDMRGLEVLNTVAQKLCNTALLEQVLDTNRLLPPDGVFVTNGSTTLTRQQIVAKFARDVKATLRRNTRLIDVSVENTNPVLAARVANSLVEDYLTEDAGAQHTTTESANKFLKEEADRQKKKLEASEQALQDYRQRVGAVSLQQSQDIVTPKLLDLSTRLTQSKANRIQAEGAYQDALKMSSNIEDLLAYPAVASDPDIIQISTDLLKHEDEFVLIKQQYREKHPKYILAARSLAGLQQQLTENVLRVRLRIQENLRTAYQHALTSEQGLEQQLSETEDSAMKLSDNAVRFNVLSREVESDKAQFDSIISRLGETSVAAQITPERIRVIQTALVPDLPSSPKIKLIFALAILGGLLAGCGLSLLVDSMDTSFQTVDQVEQFLTLPVLGTIPKLPKGKDERNKLVAAQDGNCPETEIFRTLRASLSMLGRESNRRTYLFTSSLPSEGKTFTSVNYALSLAQQGLRTLLMDIDLRKPMVEEFLTGKCNHLPGVTDYFLGKKKFLEICQDHKVPNFVWVAAGSAVPNPSELLAQSDFLQLLNEALAQFDRVVIDTAPLLPVSDTLLLADKVQTVVVVVRSRKTPRKAVQYAIRMLTKARVPVGGVVLNFVPVRRSSGYYYSYHHGYGYGTYGKKEAGKKEVEKTPMDA